MDIFKLVGSIVVNNSEANQAIDATTKKGESLAKTIGSSVQTAGQKITGVGKALAPVSMAMAGALTASVKGASDFQNGMAKMSTLVDTSKVSVSNLSKEFLTLSNQSGVSATELAEAGYQALSAGVDVNKSVQFVDTASKLARAGFTSTSTSVDVLTTAINAYGLKADDAGAISNKLVRTQNLGKTTVDELASSMGKIIPTASSMNINMDNLCGVYVSLTKQGIATAEATTYANSMFNELGKSSTITGKILKEKTGKSFQELMASGMSVADVLKILQDYSKETGTNFNELWGSAEAGKSAIALLNGGVEDFNSTVETMASDTDDVGEALEKLDTPSVKLNRSLNQIKNAGIQLGTSFMSALSPTIEKVCNGVTKLSQWFEKLPAPIKTTIATVMAVLAVASPVLIFIGKVVSSIGTLITVVPKIITAVQGVMGAVKGLWALLMANPIVLIIAGITALVAGFIYLWNTSEGFRNFWIGLWEGIKNIVSTAIQAVIGFFNNIIEFIKGNWQSLLLFIVNPFAGAFSLLYNNCEGFRTFIDGVLEAVKEAIKNAWEAIKTTTSNVWGAIKGFIVGVWTAIKTTATIVWDGIKTFITGVWDAIKQFITTTLNGIQLVMTTIWNAIKLFLTTTLNGIKIVMTTIWNGIKTVVTTIVNAIKTAVTTAWNAIKTKVTSVMNAIKTVAQSAWNAIKSTVTTVIGSIKSTVSSGLNAVKSVVSSSLNAVKSKFSSIWNSAVSLVRTAVEKLKSLVRFQWSLPQLKLPHLSVSGSFSINPPSVPSFSISWYKKAMEDGFLFTKPTIFGADSNGGLMGAGEAGDEVMIGKNNMLNMIQTAVASETSTMLTAIQDVVSQVLDKMDDISQEQGDVVIPVYLGNNMIDEVMVDAKKRVTLRSGGMTNV